MKNIWIWLLIFAGIAPVFAQTQPFTGYLYNRGFSSYLGATSTQDFMRGYLAGVLTFSVDKDGNLTCGTVNGVDVTALGPVLTFTSPLSKVGTTVSIPAAASGVSGYLTGTDWTTFNAKAPTANPAFTGYLSLNGVKMTASGDTYYISATPGDALNLWAGGTITATDMYIGAGSARFYWDSGDSELVQTKATRFEDNLTANGNITLGAPGKTYSFFGTLNEDVTVSAGKTIDGVDIGAHTHSGAAGDAPNIPQASVTGLDTALAAKLGRTTTVVTVGASGCDYTTIGAALTAITDAASDKRYTVLVYPGTYAEAVTGKAYVSIVGVNRTDCIITTAADWVISPGENSTLSTLTIINTRDDENEGTIRGIYVTADNVNIVDCSVEAKRWAVHADIGADSTVITGCTLNAPNPLFMSTGGTSVITDCVGNYASSQTYATCIGALDASYTSGTLLFARNHFSLTLDQVSTGNWQYGILVGANGEILAYDNVIRCSGGREASYAVAVARGLHSPGASPHRFYRNTIEVNSVHGSPVRTAGLAYALSIGGNYPSLEMMDNRLVATSDNAVSDDNYSVYEGAGITNSPTVTLDAASFPSLTTLAESLTAVALTYREEIGDLTMAGTVTADALVYGTTDVETEMGNKAPLASPTFSGTVSLPATSLTDNMTVTASKQIDGVDISAHTHSGAAGDAPNIPTASVTGLDTALGGKVNDTGDTMTGALAIQKTSATALTVENDGGTDTLNVDTTNGKIQIGNAAATGVIEGVYAPGSRDYSTPAVTIQKSSANPEWILMVKDHSGTERLAVGDSGLVRFAQWGMTTDAVTTSGLYQGWAGAKPTDAWKLGQPVYRKGNASNDKFALAKADAEATADVVALCNQDSSTNTLFTRYWGFLATGNWANVTEDGSTTLTAGATYWLSATTAGKITPTRPTAGGTFQKKVGIAFTTTSLWVDCAGPSIAN